MPATTKTRKATRHALSDEELDAKVAALKATHEAAVTQLLNDPAQWVEFLDTVAQFGARYSFGNQLLILVQAQKRGFAPRMVQAFGAWQQAGRLVKKGEKALQIWAPITRRFTEAEAAEHEARTGRRVRRDEQGRLPQRVVGWKIASVFDVSQTEGADVEVPEPVQVTRRVRAPGSTLPELLTGEDVTGMQDEVVRLIRAEGFSFELAAPTDMLVFGANGVTDGPNKTVQVRADVSGAQRLKTSIHELAHIRCGHVSADPDHRTHRGQAETEAESVAYIVTGALGLDSGAYSAPYVATWAQDTETLAKAAGTVVAVSKAILGALAGRQDEAPAA